MKTFEDYHIDAMKTSGQYLQPLLYAALAVAGEAGELADAIKKMTFHGHTFDQEKLLLEAGDVLWGLTYLCDVLGVSLEDVATKNIEKLKKRYPDGFNSEASIKRIDESFSGG